MIVLWSGGREDVACDETKCDTRKVLVKPKLFGGIFGDLETEAR
jgi:hypothetical protein